MNNLRYGLLTMCLFVGTVFACFTLHADDNPFPLTHHLQDFMANYHPEYLSPDEWEIVANSDFEKFEQPFCEDAKNKFLNGLYAKYPDAGFEKAKYAVTSKGFYYNPQEDTIYINKCALSPDHGCDDSKYKEFAMLHELGHFKNRKSPIMRYRRLIKIAMTEGCALAILCTTFFLVSKYKKPLSDHLEKYPRIMKPYKNMRDSYENWYNKRSPKVQKILDVAVPVAIAIPLGMILGRAVSRMSGCLTDRLHVSGMPLRRLDEVWADEHAFKYADKQALESARDVFLKCVKIHKAYGIEDLQVAQYDLGLDPHLPDQARADNISKALQERFCA